MQTKQGFEEINKDMLLLIVFIDGDGGSFTCKVIILEYFKLKLFISLCHLLITFANRLDPDQA